MLIFTPSQPAPNQGPAAKGRETRRSLAPPLHLAG